MFREEHTRRLDINYSERPFKTRIQEGENLVGSFVSLSSAGIVEILAEAGMDFIIIDQEHRPKSWETVENLIRAADVYRMPALVRVREDVEFSTLHALDVGAAGILMSFTETADQVRKAVEAMRYPPNGVRGTCTQTRASRYGTMSQKFVRYAQETASELVLMALIESPKGAANIAEMVKVDGLDAIMLGRSDLASAMGKLGQSGDPEVVAAANEVLRVVTEDSSRRTRAAMVVYSIDECEAWRRRGCSLLVNTETNLLLNAARRWCSDVRSIQIEKTLPT
jgi:4-hydroxy-2-oxoheptanedioate aldolase